MRGSTFRDIKSAPKDGTVIDVWHGAEHEQEIARAVWHEQAQAWVRADDLMCRTLHKVTGWRPVA